jgi:lysine N6-hydroxylase
MLPPSPLDLKIPTIFHATDYLYYKAELVGKRRVTLIGSGQSAAEIFQDTLNDLANCTLSWLTRSPRFFPMEVTPAAFEMSSPDYREHFYNLSPAMKEFILAGQDALYKGINANLLASIYQQLYERSLAYPSNDVSLMPNCELTVVEPSRTTQNELLCTFRHRETNQTFEHRTDALILATGYKEQPPVFLDQIKERVNYLPNGKMNIAQNYSISRDQSIFIQNAECHSHGFASSDLSFGPYRNAVILNQVLGYEYFKLEKNIAFQSFGAPNRF